MSALINQRTHLLKQFFCLHWLLVSTHTNSVLLFSCGLLGWVWASPTLASRIVFFFFTYMFLSFAFQMSLDTNSYTPLAVNFLSACSSQVFKCVCMSEDALGGKLKHKHLLYEGKQLCKRTRLLTECRRRQISFWLFHGVVFVYRCVFSMCGDVICYLRMLQQATLRDYSLLANSLLAHACPTMFYIPLVIAYIISILSSLLQQTVVVLTRFKYRWVCFWWYYTLTVGLWMWASLHNNERGYHRFMSWIHRITVVSITQNLYISFSLIF